MGLFMEAQAMTPLDFSTLSDAQINAAVAEACGWTDMHRKPFTDGAPLHTRWEEHFGTHPTTKIVERIPCYATSCDECVRLLGEEWDCNKDKTGFTICIFVGGKVGVGKDPTFSRAALLAWGRAKGVFA
jgi:hypothetical protein